LALQEGVFRSATCLVENPTLVKRVVFPVGTLPVQVVLAAVVQQLIATTALLGLMAVLGFPPRLSLAALPILLVAQILLTIGFGWTVAALHVYFRDTAHALTVLFPVWFYLTPIIYPYDMVPSLLRPVLAWNPVTTLVEGYRDVFLHGRLPGALDVLWLEVVSVSVFVLGAWIFTRLRGEFADLV
jgi:lipopolysaccharide transport system permease protein